MSTISSPARTVKECFQQLFSLPTFQRDYQWGPRHLSELVTDIQEAFLSQYERTHGRAQVAAYKPYFIGSIIITNGTTAARPIIDGQQRLTSILALLCYLHRYCAEKFRDDTTQIFDIKSLISRSSYGTTGLAIEFNPPRRKVFETYIDLSKSQEEAMDAIEDIQDLNDSDRRVIDALRQVGDQLDPATKDAIPFFVDYLIEKVILIEISTPLESDAHQIFVSMNDRGLNLAPTDLLKAYLLSKIPQPEDNRSSHESWANAINRLKAIGPDEDATFMKSWLRARWAETNRDKRTKGEEAKDFEKIADAYHRWIEENESRLGLTNSDRYSSLLKDDLPRYASWYEAIRRAEMNFTPDMPCIFYNYERGHTLQPMVLLACLASGESDTDRRAKLNLVSSYLDLFMTARAVQPLPNNYDALWEPAFQLAREIRGKSLPDLRALIATRWATQYQAFAAKLPSLEYSETREARSTLTYVLSRIASRLEVMLSLEDAVGFEKYWTRDLSGKTHDIEHLLPKASTTFADDGFADAQEYSKHRNLIGALILLPRSRNRSMQDKRYHEKLSVYATESILAKSLHPSFYQSNPRSQTLQETLPALKPVAEFKKAIIGERTALYTSIAAQIWGEPPA